MPGMGSQAFSEATSSFHLGYRRIAQSWSLRILNCRMPVKGHEDEASRFPAAPTASKWLGAHVDLRRSCSWTYFGLLGIQTRSTCSQPFLLHHLKLHQLNLSAMIRHALSSKPQEGYRFEVGAESRKVRMYPWLGSAIAKKVKNPSHQLM